MGFIGSLTGSEVNKAKKQLKDIESKIYEHYLNSGKEYILNPNKNVDEKVRRKAARLFRAKELAEKKVKAKKLKRKLDFTLASVPLATVGALGVREKIQENKLKKY